MKTVWHGTVVIITERNEHFWVGGNLSFLVFYLHCILHLVCSLAVLTDSAKPFFLLLLIKHLYLSRELPLCKNAQHDDTAKRNGRHDRHDDL